MEMLQLRSSGSLVGLVLTTLDMSSEVPGFNPHHLQTAFVRNPYNNTNIINSLVKDLRHHLVNCKTFGISESIANALTSYNNLPAMT